MHKPRKFTAILVLLLSGCCTTATTAGVTLVCKPVVPAADYDEDGYLFEIWADDSINLDYVPTRNGGVWKDELGHIKGWALAEDSEIYDRKECV